MDANMGLLTCVISSPLDNAKITVIQIKIDGDDADYDNFEKSSIEGISYQAFNEEEEDSGKFIHLSIYLLTYILFIL